MLCSAPICGRRSEYEYESLVAFDSLQGRTITRIAFLDDERKPCAPAGASRVEIDAEGLPDGDVDAGSAPVRPRHRWALYHDQDCCESVLVESVDGDPADLVGAYVTTAEEASENAPDTEDGVGAWTFYKLCTPKGDLTIRWYGTSNGFYSTSVDLEVSEGPALGAPWVAQPGIDW